jgi:hypothetical protein
MFGANRAPILRQDKHCLQTESNEHPLEPRHLGVPSCVSRTISEPMVHSAQTMHLSCTDTKTISKWTETRFHMTHVVTPQVFSCIIALHYRSISMHHFMLFHMVATNVICFKVLVWLTSCDTRELV